MDSLDANRPSQPKRISLSKGDLELLEKNNSVKWIVISGVAALALAGIAVLSLREIHVHLDHAAPSINPLGKILKKVYEITTPVDLTLVIAGVVYRMILAPKLRAHFEQVREKERLIHASQDNINPVYGGW